MNRLKNYMEKNSDKFIEYIVPLTAALIICRAFPLISFFYYAVPLILISFFFLYLNHNLHPNPNLHLNLSSSKRLKTLLTLLILFGVWAALTSAWSPFFQVSLTRTAYFLLISVTSVLLGFLWGKNERIDLFGFLLPANIIVMTVSVYSLVTSSPANAWKGGHGLGFMGYAGHQNILASAIVFTIPSVLYPLLKEISERLRNKHKGTVTNADLLLPFRLISLYLVLFISNLYFLLLSVSRAALLTLIIFFLVFIVLSSNWKTIAIALLVLISTFAMFFYSTAAVKEFIYKTEKSIGDRRAFNIAATVEAAKNGGLFGIGYGISEHPNDKRVIGHYEHAGKLFIREKMISALALIEETGIMGLLLFLLPIVYVLLKLTKKYFLALKTSLGSNTSTRINIAMMIAIILAFTVNAQIEAWWVGVGSIQLPLFFMVLGQGIQVATRNKKIENF